MNAICFDIEATDGTEILEISIMRLPSAEEIYHSYFRPVEARRWPHSEEVHHISPAMVADKPKFAVGRPTVQKLINEADVLIGFALDNDLHYLESNGIKIPDKKNVLDVRDLYWLVYGREQEIVFGNTPRLAICAEYIGLNFSEKEDAHSARNDTRATCQLLNHLLEKHFGSTTLTHEMINDIHAQYDAAYEEVRREKARGFLSLKRKGAGYVIKNNFEKPESADACIAVESRYAAEQHMRQRFLKRRDAANPGVYHLSAADIAYFNNFTIEYDAVVEAMCRNSNSGNSSRKNGIRLGNKI